MDDTAIIELFHQRDERAIRAADDAYGDYCRSIVNRFVHYVQTSCAAVSYTPTTVAYTAVMTSGAKCPVEE